VEERKLIRLNAKKSEMMNFNEVLNQYENFLHKESRKWSDSYEIDDLYQNASIGLWKAFKHYNGEVVFLTYAARCIQNEMLMWLRKTRGCQKDDRQVKSIVNLEDITGTNKDGGENLLQNFIGEVDEGIEDYGEREIKRNLLKKLSKKQLDQIECVVFKTISQDEISEKYGISQSYASRQAQVTLNRLRLDYLRQMSL
jgi:RNA polymerase sporulation-specific sigma factor